MTPEQARAVAIAQAKMKMAAAAQTAPAPAMPEAPAERSGLEQAGHVYGVAARAGQEGAVGGILGLPALIGNSVAGVARDIAYGGKKALSLTGAVDAPDPANYYPAGGAPGDMDPKGMLGLGRPADAPGAFPAVEAANRVAKLLPDALGLPEPETAAERVGSGIVNGVTGAVSGLGVGRLASMAPGTVPKALGAILEAQPGGQVAAGALGGGGGQGVVEMGGTQEAATAAGLALGTLPGFRLGSGVNAGNRTGQEIVAGRTLRGIATDADRAAENLTRAGQGATALPGWRQMTTNAAKDYGIAAVAPKMRSWANIWDNGAIAEIERNNSSILSRELDKRGAAPGEAQAAKDAVNSDTQNRIYSMNLGSLPEVDVTDLLGDMSDTARMKGTGRREAASSAAVEMRNRLLKVANPIKNEKGEVTGYTVNPEDLSAVRADLSEARFPKGGNYTGTLPSVKDAGRETKQFMSGIDDLLDGATEGRWNEYLTETRGARNEADAKSFMAGVAEKSNTNGARYDTGERQMSSGAFLAATAPSKEGTRIGRGGGMTRERLRDVSPERDSFLGRARTDIEASNFDQAPGLATRGSNTDQNREIGKIIESEVKAARPVWQRGMDAVLPFADWGTNAVSRVGGPAGSFGIRALVGGLREGITGRAATNQQAVERILGRVQADPAYGAKLMRNVTKVPGSATAPEAMLRQILKGGVLASEGFMASKRTARYK